jgi:hypothetical protein
MSSPDGHELGDFTTWVPNWSIGDYFMTGDGRRFRILSIVSEVDEDSPVMALWEVEPA